MVAVGRKGLDELKALVGAVVWLCMRFCANISPNQNPKIKTIALDLSKVDDIQPALAEIGNIDLLVNNAGIAYLEEFVNHSVEETEK